MPAPEFRKPIFNFIWMRPLRTSPDQVQFIRVGHRGVIRVFGLIAGTLAVAAFSSISIAYLFSVRNLVQSVLLAALIATISVIIFRAWTIGTYVNDHGIKIIRISTTVVIPWSSIQGIETVSTRWTIAGVPLGLTTPRVVIKKFDQSTEHTHIYIGSIDGIFSEESLAINESLLLRWWRAE